MKATLTDTKITILTTRGASPPNVLLRLAARLEGSVRWRVNGTFEVVRTPQNLEVLRTACPMAFAGPAVVERAYAAKPEPPHKPWQTGALAYLRRRLMGALFMCPGSGKTRTAIDRAGELWAEGLIDIVLVVAKNGVHRQWVLEQIPEYYNAPFAAYYWMGKRWHSPSKRAASRDALAFYCIGFDGAKAGSGKEAVLALLRAHAGRVLIIADETQEIKNIASQRHKSLVEFKRVGRAPAVIAMTGTPIAKDLTDEWAQLRWVDPTIIGVTSIVAFRAEYCVMGGFKNKCVVGHRNRDRFFQLAANGTFRVDKERLGLQPPQRRRWVFELSNAQRNALADLRYGISTTLASGEVIAPRHAIQFIARAQQISNGFHFTDEAEVGYLLWPEQPRANALLELLEHIAGEKAIVWCRYRPDFAIVSAALAQAGISHECFFGDTKPVDRDRIKQAFTKRADPRVLVASAATAGTGLNLQGLCRNAIYYSNSFASIDRLQSEDRIHRLGAADGVTFWDLIANKGVDRMILRNLQVKRELNAMALSETREVLSDLMQELDDNE